MEIVQKIKEAEKQGKEMVEQAKRNGLLESENVVSNYNKQKEEAQKQRTEMINNAVLSAETQAKSQAESLKNDTGKQIELLISQANSKMSGCCDKIISTIQSI